MRATDALMVLFTMTAAVDRIHPFAPFVLAKQTPNIHLAISL
jgi:hypothetical protein